MLWGDLQTFLVETLPYILPLIMKRGLADAHHQTVTVSNWHVYKKSVHKKLAVFTGKHLCWSLFWVKVEIKLQAIRPATLLERDSSTYFPVNIEKFIIKPVLNNICILLLSKIKKFLGKLSGRSDHYMINNWP